MHTITIKKIVMIVFYILLSIKKEIELLSYGCYPTEQYYYFVWLIHLVLSMLVH